MDERPSTLWCRQAVRGDDDVRYTVVLSSENELLTALRDSGELQRRLDLDPVLNNVSILGIDPGFMTTGIARRHESWFVRNVIHGLFMTVVVRLLSWIRPSGLFRTEKKSAGHILAAAFSSDAPFSQRPKALHLDGLQLKEPSAESKDPRKRKTLWRDSIRYAHVEEGDTILADWR